MGRALAVRLLSLSALVLSAVVMGTLGYHLLEGWSVFDSLYMTVITLATIGYGRISPVSLGANLLVTVEALFGMLTIAVGSGLLFARFSRPTARVVFSDKALIAAVDGEPQLMFRMANARLNQIVEAQVGVILLITERTAEGQSFRNLYDLKLERSTYEILTVLGISLLDKTPVKELFSKIDNNDVKDLNINQLSLSLF